MKIKTLYGQIIKPRHKLIAAFGHARLVRWRNGKYELIGGLPEDLAQAREWISLFLHEAVPSCAEIVAAFRKSAAISCSQVRTARCSGSAEPDGGALTRRRYGSRANDMNVGCGRP
jgi:hypothetical protein